MKMEEKLLPAPGEAQEMPAEAKALLPEEKPQRELCSSITFKLRDGRIVEMGDPPVPVDLLLPSLLPSPEGDGDRVDMIKVGLNSALIEVLLMIRSVGGQPTTVGNRNQLNALAVQLGNQGLRDCKKIFNKHFSDTDSDTLEVIKKNVRTYAV